MRNWIKFHAQINGGVRNVLLRNNLTIFWKRSYHSSVYYVDGLTVLAFPEKQKNFFYDKFIIKTCVSTKRVTDKTFPPTTQYFRLSQGLKFIYDHLKKKLIEIHMKWVNRSQSTHLY